MRPVCYTLMTARTATIRIDDIKEPDAWPQLADDLGLSDATRERYFEHGEYAGLELTFDASLNVISGRLIPRDSPATRPELPRSGAHTWAPVSGKSADDRSNPWRRKKHHRRRGNT